MSIRYFESDDGPFTIDDTPEIGEITGRRGQYIRCERAMVTTYGGFRLVNIEHTGKLRIKYLRLDDRELEALLGSLHGEMHVRREWMRYLGERLKR